MNGKRNNHISVYQLCLVAMAVVMNAAGAQLALTLRLPVYLDSIGTILAGAMLGPVYGMLPSLLSGIVLGMTIDIYSLYFAPAGMIVGLMSGLAWKMNLAEKGRLWLAAAVVAVPLFIVLLVVMFASDGRQWDSKLENEEESK